MPYMDQQITDLLQFMVGSSRVRNQADPHLQRVSIDEHLAKEVMKAADFKPLTSSCFDRQIVVPPCFEP